MLGPPYRRLIRSAGATEDLFVTRGLHQEPPPRIPTGQAAMEIQDKTSIHLRTRSDRVRQHSMRVLGTAEEVSGDDPSIISTAVQTSANMVGRGKAELIGDLRERKAHLGQRQLTNADWLHIDKLTNPSTQFKGTHTPKPTASTWEGGARKSLNHDSPLQKVGNQSTHSSFKDPPSRTNVFREIEGTLNNNRGQEREEGEIGESGPPPAKTLKFQFRNPNPNPNHNFQDSQTGYDESCQSRGGRGRGPTYKRHFQSTNRGGYRGKRPRGDQDYENGETYHQPRSQSRGPRGRGREPNTQLSEREWALIRALRE